MMIKIFSLSLSHALSLSISLSLSLSLSLARSLARSHFLSLSLSLFLSLSLSLSFSLIDVIMIMKMSALGGECERARGERKIRGEGGGGAARNCFVLFACECAKMLRCAPARSRHNPACRSASMQGRVCKTSSRLLFMGCASCLFMGCSAGWPRPWRGVPAQPTVVLAIDSSEPDEL